MCFSFLCSENPALNFTYLLECFCILNLVERIASCHECQDDGAPYQDVQPFVGDAVACRDENRDQQSDDTHQAVSEPEKAEVFVHQPPNRVRVL